MADKTGRTEPAKLILSIALACLIGMVLAAVTAAVILRYVAVGSPQSRYDDPAAILAEYDEETFRGAALAADGSLTVTLGEKDIYWYASEYGILQRFEERLAETDSKWQVRRYGFEIDGSRVIVHLSCSQRLFPVYFRAVYDTECQGTVMHLYPREVAVGGYAELEPSRWPPLLPREGFSLDFAQMGISRALRSVKLENGSLVLCADGLSQAMTGQLTVDRELTDALAVYGTGALDTWGILSWVLELGTEKIPMGEAQSMIQASGNTPAAMAELMACCTGASRMEVLGGWDRFTLDFAALQTETQAADRRSSLQRYIASEQWKYEKLLTSVRELYKSGALTLSQRSFTMTATGGGFDPAALSGSLSLTATDSRPLLLQTFRGGATGIRTTDMPPLQTVPRTGDRALEGLDPACIYDIGMLMTTENGVPVLIHYRNDGVFVLREVSDSMYTALLLHSGNPAVDTDSLWAPAERRSTVSAMGISNFEILLLEE